MLHCSIVASLLKLKSFIKTSTLCRDFKKLLFQTVFNYLCPHLLCLQGAREESLHLLRRFYKVRAHRNYTPSSVHPGKIITCHSCTRMLFIGDGQVPLPGLGIGPGIGMEHGAPYQKMAVCDTTVKNRLTSCLDKHSTNLTAPITKCQEKIRVARQWFVLGSRLYRLFQYLASYAFFFFHRSNQ